MDNCSKKTLYSLLFFFFAAAQALLLTGCEDRKTSERSDQEQILLDLDNAHTQTDFSAGAQETASNRYKSFSVVGQGTKIEMVSSKYKLNATLVVPAHTPN